MAQLVRILQIGDVHFPDGSDSPAHADIKDDGVTTEFTGKFANHSFQASARKMLSLLESESVDMVAFMGDLTSKGCLTGYSECLDFLSRGLRLESEPLIETNRIMVVAGNHDVCSVRRQII